MKKILNLLFGIGKRKTTPALRQFSVEFPCITIEAENHQDAARRAFTWLANEFRKDGIILTVGDLAELNDPISPFISPFQIHIDKKGTRNLY